MRHLGLDDVERRLRQRWVQLVVSQQRDATIEMLGQRRDREICAGALPGTDGVELLLECDTIQLFMTRCNISVRQNGCSRASSRVRLGSLDCPSPTLVAGLLEPRNSLPDQIDQTRFGYP